MGIHKGSFSIVAVVKCIVIKIAIAVPLVKKGHFGGLTV